MSGWARRRTSGEIMNATLLEVFLALSFMIFGLAVFEQRNAKAAEEALARAPSTATVDSLRRLAEAMKQQMDLLADSMGRMADTIHALRFRSPYPPDCEENVVPAELMTITFAGPGTLTVLPNRSKFGLTAGSAFTTTIQSFRRRFAEVERYSRQKGCRFLVRIVDTPRMSKAEYKAALAAITSIFRFRNAFR